MFFVNSFSYNLLKILYCILLRLFGNEFNVRSTEEFVDHVNNISVNSSEILVSFDVVSLFTTVPVDKALKFV